MTYFNRLLLQCRSGFEKEAAAEIIDQCGRVGIYGYCTLQAKQGYVEFHIPQPGEAERALEAINFFGFIFIRQWMVCGDCLDVGQKDRISSIEAVLHDFPECTELWAEYADTTEGREVVTFSRKFASALSQKLKQKKFLPKKPRKEGNRLTLFVLDGSHIFVGYTPANNASPWPLGILRLKFPKSAPSRSTLKLEEAWHWFIPRSQWDERLAHGSTAVDLGAAPGGWTWQLVRRSMFVTAVDNGPMSHDLMETGQVRHVQEDAYQFVPERPVQMMVCDVVDKPAKTAHLAADWVLNGWCQEAIFNLKLPMKQRYQAVMSCMNLIAERFKAEGVAYELSGKQLYHDREEVTCLLRIR